MHLNSNIRKARRTQSQTINRRKYLCWSWTKIYLISNMYKGRACLLSRHISMSRYYHLQTLTIMSLMTTFYIHNDNNHHSPNPLCVPLHLLTPLSTCATHSSQPSNSTISLPTACTDSLQCTINNSNCFTQTLNRSLQPYSPNSQCCLR